MKMDPLIAMLVGAGISLLWITFSDYAEPQDIAMKLKQQACEVKERLTDTYLNLYRQREKTRTRVQHTMGPAQSSQVITAPNPEPAEVSPAPVRVEQTSTETQVSDQAPSPDTPGRAAQKDVARQNEPPKGKVEPLNEEEVRSLLAILDKAHALLKGGNQVQSELLERDLPDTGVSQSHVSHTALMKEGIVK